jgi:hypothetical protein
MVSFRIREILFGNWRNKGVALFFAITIWVVAYQAETQEDKLRIRLIPAERREEQVIIRQECEGLAPKQVPFDGIVVLTVSGPRRQIEKLRAFENREVRFPVEAPIEGLPGQHRVTLTEGTFSFIPSSVKIVSILPGSILLTFDAAEDREFPVEPVLRGIPEGMEVETPKIEPPAVKVHGPRSYLDVLRVTVEVGLGATEKFEDTLPLSRKLPETVDRTVADRIVRFLGPSQARVTTRLRYKNDIFDAEGVRLRFLIPAGFPFRIGFDEETVKVRFQGPVGEIRRLREKVKDPDFALAVQVQPPAPGRPVPRGTERDAGAADGEQTLHFTEDVLLLYGFSDRVQILQHPQRRDQGKGFWTYALIPGAPPARTGG